MNNNNFETNLVGHIVWIGTWDKPAEKRIPGEIVGVWIDDNGSPKFLVLEQPDARLHVRLIQELVFNNA